MLSVKFKEDIQPLDSSDWFFQCVNFQKWVAGFTASDKIRISCCCSYCTEWQIAPCKEQVCVIFFFWRIKLLDLLLNAYISKELLKNRECILSLNPRTEYFNLSTRKIYCVKPRSILERTKDVAVVITLDWVSNVSVSRKAEGIKEL